MLARRAPDRRALGRRPDGYQVGRFPGPLPRLERPVPRRRARLLAAAAAWTAASSRAASPPPSDLFHHGQRRPTASSTSYRRARRLHAGRPGQLRAASTTTPTARTTATAATTRSAPTSASKGPRDDPAITALAPARAPRHARPRCCWRRARRCCAPATRSATASRATTTPTARTTRPAGWTGPAPTHDFREFVARRAGAAPAEPLLRHDRWFHSATDVDSAGQRWSGACPAGDAMQDPGLARHRGARAGLRDLAGQRRAGAGRGQRPADAAVQSRSRSRVTFALAARPTGDWRSTAAATCRVAMRRPLRDTSTPT